jgi:hypothetical protein
MPNINDRIGSQNVIRVLSNASAPPTRLLNLTDVNSTLKTRDGMILVWDLATESFFMTDTIDSSILNITGIATFSNTTDSSAPTSGALVVNGGIGIGKAVNIGGNLKVAGVSTFSSNLDINAAVDILNGLTVNSTFKSVGITTLASAGGITTTGGELYVGTNLEVAGTSNFIGNATFRGGTIGIGDSSTDDIDVGGEFVSNLVPNTDNTFDIGITTQRWRDGKFSGLVTTTNLFASGVSTFAGAANFNGNIDIDGNTELDDVNVSGIATINTLEVTQSTTLKHAGSTKFITTGTGVSISSGTGNTAIIAGPENFIIDPAAVGDNTGKVTIKGDLFVLGSETSISSQTIELADHRVGIATTVGTNILLDGGGIGIGSAAILKTILWNNSSTSLKSSENWDLTSGKSYKINGTDVLTSTTLGTGVTNSSLTSVGTLNSLNVSGLSTFTGIVTTASDLYVGGDLYVNDDITLDEVTLRNANITGIATIGTLGVTGLTTTQNLRVAGLSTFVGVATFSTNVFVAGTLDAGLIDGGEY